MAVLLLSGGIVTATGSVTNIQIGKYMNLHTDTKPMSMNPEDTSFYLTDWSINKDNPVVLVNFANLDKGGRVHFEWYDNNNHLIFFYNYDIPDPKSQGLDYHQWYSVFCYSNTEISKTGHYYVIIKSPWTTPGNNDRIDFDVVPDTTSISTSTPTETSTSTSSSGSSGTSQTPTTEPSPTTTESSVPTQTTNPPTYQIGGIPPEKPLPNLYPADKTRPNIFYPGIDWNDNSQKEVRGYADTLNARLIPSYFGTDIPEGIKQVGLLSTGFTTDQNYPDDGYEKGYKENGNYIIAYGHSGGTSTLVKKIQNNVLHADYVVLASPALIKQSDLTDLVENHKVKKIIVLQAKDDILYEVESGYSLFSPINSDKNKNKIVVKTFEAGELNQHYHDTIDITPNTFEYEIRFSLIVQDIKLTMNQINVHNDLRRMMIEMFPNLKKVIKYKGNK